MNADEWVTLTYIWYRNASPYRIKNFKGIDDQHIEPLQVDDKSQLLLSFQLTKVGDVDVELKR